MSDINTGGPAYPAPTTKPLENYYPGISIRDYFAAKAMQGLLAGITPTTVWSHDEAAETAYNVADAMLKAREA
jgi:hypothetical protein